MTAKKSTKKVWKYHVCHSYEQTDNGVKVNFVTQLYQVGVYGIVNNNPAMQGNFTPNQLVSLEKRLNKALSEGKIKDLVFGREIKVTTQENSGLLVEVTE